MPILNKKGKMKRLRLRIAFSVVVWSVKLCPSVERRMENSVDNRREHVRRVPPHAHPALWCSLHGNAGFPGNPTSPPSGVVAFFTFRVSGTLDFNFCLSVFYFSSCHVFKGTCRCSEKSSFKKSRLHPVLKTKSDLFFLSDPIAPPTGLSGDAACSSKNAPPQNVADLSAIKKQKWNLHLCHFCFEN